MDLSFKVDLSFTKQWICENEKIYVELFFVRFRSFELMKFGLMASWLDGAFWIHFWFFLSFKTIFHKQFSSFGSKRFSYVVIFFPVVLYFVEGIPLLFCIHWIAQGKESPKIKTKFRKVWQPVCIFLRNVLLTHWTFCFCDLPRALKKCKTDLFKILQTFRNFSDWRTSKWIGAKEWS